MEVEQNNNDVKENNKLNQIQTEQQQQEPEEQKEVKELDFSKKNDSEENKIQIEKIEEKNSEEKQQSPSEQPEQNQLVPSSFEEQRTAILSNLCKAINAFDFEKAKEITDKYQEEYDILNKYDFKLETMALVQANLLPDEKAVQMLRFLIDQGADPNTLDKQGQTVMFYVCRDGKLKCYEFLRSQGIAIDKEDYVNQIPLFYACRDGQLEIVKRLIEEGVNINHLDSIKQSCLFYAAREGRLEVCQYLIDKGIKINQLVFRDIYENIKQDHKRQNALNYAKKNRHSDVIQLLQNLIPKSRQNHLHSSNLKRKLNKDEPKIQYKLTFTDKDGIEKQLGVEEMEEFSKNFPEIASLLQYPDTFVTESMIENFKENETWDQVATGIIQSLWKLKGAYLFHQPVDIVKMQCDDYYEIIKQPMDFSTIKNKLSHHLYHNINEFVDDVNLVFANCITYNGENTEIGKVGMNFQNEFTKLCKMFNVESIKKVI